VKNHNRETPLVRSDGEYKIDLWLETLPAADGPEGRKLPARFREAGEAYESAIQGVTEGRYRSARDVAKWTEHGCGLALSVVPDAPTTRPLIKPATHPVKVDLSKPRQTCESLAEAMIEGDGRAFAACLLARNPQEQEIIDLTISACVTGPVNLWLAAAKRFGPDAAEAFFDNALLPNGHDDGINSMLLLPKARIDVLEKHATVELPGPVNKSELELVDGQWKLQLRNDLGPEGLKLELRRMAAIASIYRQLTQEIEAGRHATMDDAIKALDTLSRAPAATQPTTSP
jgi:hypothetical protein